MASYWLNVQAACPVAFGEVSAYLFPDGEFQSNPTAPGRKTYLKENSHDCALG